MRACCLILLLAACTPSPAAEPGRAAGDATTTVLVVRHFERASGEPNADLSPQGLARAGALRELAVAAGIAAAWVTNFCRTAQAAHPAAVALGLPLRVASTGSRSGGLDACTPAIETELLILPDRTPPDALARLILSEWRGRAVLVVGHSNTVPPLVEALGAPSPCGTFLPPAVGECHLSEDAYGDLFIVRIRSDATPTVEHRRVGAD